MNTYDLLADIAVDGVIEGVGIGSTPQECVGALGTDFVDEKARKRFRRDYGLVELGFFRVDDAWRCGTFTVQTHRLWRFHDSTGPALLRAKYGDFVKSVAFDDLRNRLAGRGQSTIRIADRKPGDQQRYYLADSTVLITVVGDGSDGEDYPPPGSVWSLSLSDNAEAWLRPH